MKILFVAGTAIGDAVLATTALAALVDRYPGSDITVACGPAAGAVLRLAPGVVRVHTINKGQFKRHWLSLWWATVGARWDYVVDLRGSALAWCLWARERRVLRSDRLKPRVPHIASVLSLGSDAGPRVWAGASARERAAEIIPAGAIVLALAPLSHWPPKTWPIERFVELVERLTCADGPLPGAKVLVVGSPKERPAAQPLIDAVPADRLILAMDGDLELTIALLARVRLFVGNDSGPMHVAAAAGAPTLGLFGPGNEAIYGPWGPRARVVRGPRGFEELSALEGWNQPGRDHSIEELSVDRAFSAAEKLLADTAPVDFPSDSQEALTRDPHSRALPT